MIGKGEAVDIWTLQRQGCSWREIGRRLGLDRRTVKKYVEQGELPAPSRRERRLKLEPYQRMIRDWLEMEDYKAVKVMALLRVQGYGGSYETVSRYVGRIVGNGG